jgi:membrane protease YdiL (CAAX protease family)
MRAKKTLTAPLLVLCMMLLAIGSRYVDAAVLGYGDQLYLSIIIIKLIVFVLPSIFYCKLCGPGYALKLNLRLVSPGRLGFMLFAFFVLLTGSILLKLTIGLTGAAATEFAGYESLVAITEAATLSDILYIVTAFAVLPALSEEFAFRAVVLTEYNGSGLGTVMSLILSSFLYGLIHFRPDMLLINIFQGAVLALAVYVTRSVLAAAAIRILYNLINIFFGDYILRLVPTPDNLSLIFFIAISLFLFSLVLMFGEAERLYHNDALISDDREDREQTGRKTGGMRILGEAVMSPALLLCIGVFIIGSFI